MKARVVMLMLPVAMAFAASSGIVAEGRIGLPISWQRRNNGTPGEIYTLHSKLGCQMLRVSQIWVGSSAADAEHGGMLTMKILKDIPAGLSASTKGRGHVDKLETAVDGDGGVTCFYRGYSKDDACSEATGFEGGANRRADGRRWYVDAGVHRVDQRRAGAGKMKPNKSLRAKRDWGLFGRFSGERNSMAICGAWLISVWAK